VDLQELEAYIKAAEELGLAELAVGAEGHAFRFRRGVAVPAAGGVTPPRPESAPGAPAQAPGQDHVVRSRFVGFFHRGDGPDRSPLVGLGDRVTPGQRLGTVETLRTLNEVTAEVAGTVTDILVESGDAVEYGEPLIVIKPD